MIWSILGSIMIPILGIIDYQKKYIEIKGYRIKKSRKYFFWTYISGMWMWIWCVYTILSEFSKIKLLFLLPIFFWEIYASLQRIKEMENILDAEDIEAKKKKELKDDFQFESFFNIGFFVLLSILLLMIKGMLYQ